jgi:hypothetical protein
MPLDRNDADMISTEFKLIGLKLDQLNNYLSQIQQTEYQSLLEQVKQTELLQQILLKG